MRVLRRDSAIVLSGPPGVGKSAVGPLLASRLGRPFVDVDRLIEARERQTVFELFAQGGEGAFRDLERSAIRSLLDDGAPSVIAVGGGALVDDALRGEVLSTARVISLTASQSTLEARLRMGAERPIFAGKVLSAALNALLRERASAYAEAHCIVSTEDFMADEVVAQIVNQLDELCVLVQLGERSYRARIGVGVAERMLDALDPTRRRLWVVDGAWARANASHPLVVAIEHEHVVEVDPREKSIEQVTRVWAAASEMGLERDGVIAACGGGHVGDLAGFAAATWKRGCDWINVPTTSLAMVDSCLGGKTGVNFSETKNVVGAFHQPREVFVDPSWLRTLAPEEMRRGLVEAVKCAVLSRADADVFESRIVSALAGDALALEDLIAASLSYKARLVAEDELDRGPRHALNFGHTVGHAIELATGVAHGVAVAHGMLAEFRMMPGTTSQSAWTEAQLRKLSVLDPIAVSEEAFRAGLKNDKKRHKSGEISIFGPADSWTPREYRVTEDQVVDAFFAYLDSGR